MTRWLRPAVGLIAAYAIALQAILTGLVPVGAVAPAGLDAVICHGGVVDDAQPDQGNGPVDHPRHVEHCALCAVSALVAPVLADVVRSAPYPVLLAAPRPAQVLLPHDIHARPGKPRDPPLSA